MVFSVTRSALGFSSSSSLLISNSKKWHKILYVAQRWSSFQPIGSAPSQLPLPGEAGWAGLIENMERYKYQAPLSPAEVRDGQAIYMTEKKIEQLQVQINHVFSSILKSNKSLKAEEIKSEKSQ